MPSFRETSTDWERAGLSGQKELTLPSMHKALGSPLIWIRQSLGPTLEMTYEDGNAHLGGPDLRGTQMFVLGKACNICGLDALFSPHRQPYLPLPCGG